MKLSNSQEEYLKTIYILENSKKKIRVTEIAKKMNITKPSVTKAMRNLNELELIEYQTYGDIILTPKGNKMAKEILKREDIVETFLVEVLEIDSDVAKKEAIAMKHVISEETAKKLELYISEIFDLDSLDCDYDINSEKCRNCIKVTAKTRMKKE